MPINRKTRQNEIMTQNNHADTIEKMKKWCLDNYTQGADTMVECWDDSTYLEMIEDEGTDEAWRTLKSLAEIYLDRQNDARNSVF